MLELEMHDFRMVVEPVEDIGSPEVAQVDSMLVVDSCCTFRRWLVGVSEQETAEICPGQETPKHAGWSQWIVPPTACLGAVSRNDLEWYSKKDPVVFLGRINGS